MSIGTNIKNLRMEHGLSQLQIAKITGTTDKAVSSWENDISIPRMGAIEKLAAYFGIRKSDIIEDSEALPQSEITHDLSEDKIEQVKKFADFLRSSQ